MSKDLKRVWKSAIWIAEGRIVFLTHKGATTAKARRRGHDWHVQDTARTSVAPEQHAEEKRSNIRVVKRETR